MSIQKTKVAIIGAGNVGTTVAYALMMDDIVTDIALVDINQQKVEGQALDLDHGIQFSTAHSVTGGTSFELVKDAQIVVVAAGFNQNPRQTRMELLEANAEIVHDVCTQIVQYNNECIILVVTNPVDVMTYVAWKSSGLSAQRVIGTGTVLDTARLRAEISRQIRVSPKEIAAYVIGEHGENEFVWWRGASIAGLPLELFPQWTDSFKKNIEESVYTAAENIIERKGMTNFAIGLVVAKIIRAFLTHQTRIFSLSTIVGLGTSIQSALSVPVIINKTGVVERLPLPFNADELLLLNNAFAAIFRGVSFVNKRYNW